jgi:hypothetical protein
MKLLDLEALGLRCASGSRVRWSASNRSVRGSSILSMKRTTPIWTADMLDALSRTTKGETADW